MTSQRLMGIGNSIMKMKNRNLSTDNISLLDFSAKSIRTNSTFETPIKTNDNIKEIINTCTSINTMNNKPFDQKRFSTESNYFPSIYNKVSKLTNNSKSHVNILLSESNKNRDISKLISFADKILKERRNNHLTLNQLIKSIYMKKVNEICLNNYKINLIKNKRIELNNKLVAMNKAIKSSEKGFEKDYEKFLDFVDSKNRAIYKQENIINKYKKILEEKEAEYNRLNLINNRLKREIEHYVKRILVLKKYGTFIHDLFKINFLYENIKKQDRKNYFNIAEEIIKIYEKNEKSEKKDDKLLDEYWLMAQFTEFEQNIMKTICERESFKNDCAKNEIDEQEEMNKLKEKIKHLQKRLEMALEDNEKFIKSMKKYDIPEEMNTILEYIAEFTQLIGLKDEFSYALLKEKNSTNYTILCTNIIKSLREKEILINNYMKDFETILNGNNEEDKALIEKLISERKKVIKKAKISFLVKERKEESRKKNKKAVERAHRIVIKGRKVIDYYPLIKIKKKQKKIVTETNDDDYLYYSSDENK